jgi:hydrid cluster protein-associated redox disulfide domain
LTWTVLSAILDYSNRRWKIMEKVNRDMNIMEAVERYPIIAQVLMRYGLGCVGCIISSAETLGEGIAAHGLNPDIIIEEVNMILEKQGE